MPAKTKTEIGAEVESICTKCKIPTVHIITALDGDAITKVMCKICNSYHKPKFEQGSTKKAAPKAKKAKTTKATKAATKVKPTKTSEERKWNRLLKKLVEYEPIEYEMSDSYKDDSVIDHPNFGLGVVIDVLSQKKIHVFFQTGPKTLVHNWE